MLEPRSTGKPRLSILGNGVMYSCTEVAEHGSVA